MKKKLFESIMRISLIIAVVILIKAYLFQPFFMLDSGMLPALKENRIYLLNKLIYRLREPKRGDIILFRATGDPPLFFIARIVGRPKETLEIKKGVVYISGKALREDYADPNLNWNLDKIEIKKSCFFILGDNRQMSLANHFHVQVAKKNILGKIAGKR